MLLSQFNPEADWAVWIQNNFTTGDHWLYMVTFFLLIVFFTYFYVSITFNPKDVADNMKKYGGSFPASGPADQPRSTSTTS